MLETCLGSVVPQPYESTAVPLVLSEDDEQQPQRLQKKGLGVVKVVNMNEATRIQVWFKLANSDFFLFF